MENLDALKETLRMAEDQEFNKYKAEGISVMDARCRFEEFRAKVIFYRSII